MTGWWFTATTKTSRRERSSPSARVALDRAGGTVCGGDDADSATVEVDTIAPAYWR